MKLADVEDAYDAALNTYQIAKINYEQGQTSSQEAVANAEEALADAQANLAAAQAGPDTADVAVKQVAVTVAEATLADAQANLTELQNGPDPDEVAAAEIRVQIAQNTLDKLTLRAPFDGEVLAVNYLRGDLVAQNTAAVVIANRTTLHVDASIDESDVTSIGVGDEVAITFDSLPNLNLNGTVQWINPVGETVQGLVRYTVRINLAQTDPSVLLNMTANVNIVTDLQEGALAVPLDAVQLDDAGEYVNRVNALGIVERVDVVSGAVQDDYVIVTGSLNPGDQVQLIQPVPTNNGGPFEPG
jgi:HlyD family secretion protein